MAILARSVTTLFQVKLTSIIYVRTKTAPFYNVDITMQLASEFIKGRNNFMILDHIKIKVNAYNILLNLTKRREREITESTRRKRERN